MQRCSDVRYFPARENLEAVDSRRLFSCGSCIHLRTPLVDPGVELELDVDVDTDVDEDAVVCAIVVLEVGEDDRQEMSGPYST